MGNLAPEAAAELTATFKQSLGIMDDEFVRFVDEMQKAKFAFGLDPEMFAYTLKYIGPIGKQLGLIGLEGGASLFPLAGMLSQAGIKGEQLGTSLRATMLHLPELEKRLASPLHKSGEILDQAGITLEFFRNGRFLGIEHFVGQLQQLQRLDVASRLLVLKELFGEETASALAEIVGQGLGGYRRAQETLAKQAELQERLNRVMGTYRNLWEAFTGTLENVFARLGGSIGPELKTLAIWLNTVSDAVGGFMERHPSLTKAFVMTAAVTGVLLIASGSLLITLALLTRGYAHVLTGISTVTQATRIAIPWIYTKAGAIWRLIGVQRLLAAIEYRGGFWNAFQYWLMIGRYRMLELIATSRAWIATNLLTIAGLKGLAASTWAWTTALLTNPIALVVAGVVALAAAAYLVYRYWGPISAFFRDIWKAVLNGIRGIGPALKAAGATLLRMLVDGMASMAHRPVELMRAMMTKVRAFLPFSPAKEGPLRDLHRIRLVETIAQAVRPAPLMQAMSRTAAAAALAAPLLVAPALAGGPDASRSVPSVFRAQPAGAPITIHYAPTITIGPGAPAGAGAVREVLHRQMRQDADELVRLIEEAQRRRARGTY
jgi:TP901 family phage tail tape measure protein